jgi:hypothetical protein
MKPFLAKMLKIAAILILICGSFGVGMLVAQLKINKEKEVQNKLALAQKDSNLELEKEKIENQKNIQLEQAEAQAVQENAVSNSEEAETTKFSFAVIGDSQNDPSNPLGNLSQAAQNIEKQKVDFVLAMGDLVSSCNNEKECLPKLKKWKSFFKQAVYPTQGNHDRTGKEKADKIWINFFNLPTNGPSKFSEIVYSFNFKNTHFVSLASDNPEESIINKTQRAWLEADLAKNKQKNIFVFFHEPAYPINSKIGEGLDANPSERNALWAILKKYKVTAVFSGHEHIAARKRIDGVYQFIFGNTDSFDHLAPVKGAVEYSFVGSNYGIIEVVGEVTTVKTFSADGALLDTFVVPR